MIAPSSPRRRRRQRQRFDQTPTARRVRGIENYRKMRELFETQRAAEIADVARVRIEAADATLAEHDIRIAFNENVLRGEQQLVERCRWPALEKNREARSRGGTQEWDVLHVARADLHHVGICRNELHVRFRERLGDDRQIVTRARIRDERQPRIAEPLEIVR